MKKFMKNNILGFLLGGIIFGGISVGATILYNSNEVSYIPNDSSFDVSNVKEALDQLHDEVSHSSKSVTMSYSGGGYIVSGLSASGSLNITNDGYTKLTVSSGTSSIVFVKTDGTSTTAVSVTKGNSINIPTGVVTIMCSSKSGTAGNDGWGGSWLSGTASIVLE